MKRGEYTLATQVGGKGYYGKVALEYEPEGPSGTVTIEFDKSAAQKWTSGARFGIDYVLEQLPRKAFPNGARILVQSIQGHEVDTNNVVIAFATANALLSALELPVLKKPDFDKEKGLFLFPK
jgi:hypothetical protein